ncbi:hypothetical protein [Komagataeibacter saccharivorans]|uniref:hypothetical protein n=1 Tax=Komagataeibacter saccharivorans TaxID=265959 RepID=UPI0039EB579C
MGQAKNKKQRFLAMPENSICCYCGRPAETIDHFPPRTIYSGRNWPEGYEFPACNSCNQSKKHDEQSLGLLVRLMRFDIDTDDKEFQEACRAVHNNNKVLFSELQFHSAVVSKKNLQARFGSARQVSNLGLLGWRTCSCGPESERLIDNFCVWFAQTAWFLHSKTVFSGRIIWNNLLVEHLDFEPAQKIINNLVGYPTMMRNGKNVSKDFFYKYFSNEDIFVAFFQFGSKPQMIFVVCATRQGVIDINTEIPDYWGRRDIVLLSDN